MNKKQARILFASAAACSVLLTEGKARSIFNSQIQNIWAVVADLEDAGEPETSMSISVIMNALLSIAHSIFEGERISEIREMQLMKCCDYLMKLAKLADD